MTIDKSKRLFGKTLGGLSLSALTLNTLGVTGLLSSSNAMAASGDYKALVYVYLFGGNDSFNMVVPKEAGDLRTRYETGRTTVALAADSLHTLNLRSDALISSGETYNGFGMHPNCGDLAGMFNDGELGVLSNVGNLIVPTDRTSYSATGHQLPPQLFSHSDQSRQLMSEPVSALRYGWGGRVAEILAAHNTDQTLSPLISTAGLNPYQVSLNRIINTYSTGFAGPPAVKNLTEVRETMLERLMNSPSFDAFSKHNRRIFQEGLSAASTVTEAFDIADNSMTDYDGIFTATGAGTTSLGKQLKAVAKLIKGREVTTNNRPVYFVRIGGFDQHTHLLEDHAEKMAEVNNALKAFRDTLVEQGDFDKTLTHIGSEFGRTFTSNGLGTDHGWGGNMMVMGEPINGGHLFGRYPDLVVGGERDADRRSRGRWIPQTSTHQTAAIMSNWLGVQKSDLEGIFPTLANFEDSFGSNANLGFIREGV
jgi:uncharacterized protein (DUF1501 family)